MRGFREYPLTDFCIADPKWDILEAKEEKKPPPPLGFCFWSLEEEEEESILFQTLTLQVYELQDLDLGLLRCKRRWRQIKGGIQIMQSVFIYM